MIKGGELDNRQIGGAGTATGTGTTVDVTPRRGRRPEPQDQVDAAADLARRIEAARNLRAPRPSIEHCGHCWGEGRDAAIRVIEGDA